MYTLLSVKFIFDFFNLCGLKIMHIYNIKYIHIYIIYVNTVY